MDLEYFPHFIRKNYPTTTIANASNEDLREIGKGFKKYLLEIFKENKEKLDEIWDISPMKIILHQEHPLKTNGYEPALIVHFGLYVDKIKKEIQDGIHDE